MQMKTMAMSMTMMMMMMMMMTITTLTSVAGQNAWPEKPAESSKDRIDRKIAEIGRRNQLDVFQEFFFVDFSVVSNDLYNQLYLSDDEAAEACKAVQASAFIKSGGISAPHPRTCFAKLLCAGFMFNSKRRNTPYFYDVQVRATSPGTYYSPSFKQARRWTTNNSCAVDPCKTRRNMTTGRSCYTYVTCGIDGQGQDEHQERRCPEGQGFSALLGICAPDASCIRPEALKTENVRCYATGRPTGSPRIPGVPDTAYYNRTYRVVETGGLVTVREMCPASLVFDPQSQNSTELCKCVPYSQETCHNLTLVHAGHNTPLPWTSAIDPHDYTVDVVMHLGQHLGWARFHTNVDYNYYHAQALAHNELTGDWTLTFRFQLDPLGGNPATFALAQNSLDPVACPDPSIRVSVVNSHALRADVMAKDHNRTVSAQLDNVMNPAVSEAVQVVVERRGDRLVLRARKHDNDPFRQTSADGLGQGPLAANRCGLVFGQEFSGWLESVKLEKLNC